MKIHLLIPAILLLFPGTLKHDQQESNLNAERNCSSTIVETSSNTEQAPVDQDPDMKNFYFQLTIDHLFVYNNPMINYQISVKGILPVHVDEEFFIYVKVPKAGVKVATPAATYSGKGKVKVSGRGSMDAGSFKVKKIDYDSEMNIEIKAKENYREEKDFEHLINIALQENWNQDLNWDIETSDPENDKLRLDMFKMVVPTKMPDSPPTGRTIEYMAKYSPYSQTYEHVSSVPGMGTFRWRYILSYVSAKTLVAIKVKDDHRSPDGEQHSHWEYVEKDPYKTDVNPKNDQLNFTDDRPKPKDSFEIYEPRLGPPLESIVWEIVSENAPVIVDL